MDAKTTDDELAKRYDELFVVVSHGGVIVETCPSLTHAMGLKDARADVTVWHYRLCMMDKGTDKLVARLRAAAQLVRNDDYARANEYVRGCMATKMVFARELLDEFFPEERDGR